MPDRFRNVKVLQLHNHYLNSGGEDHVVALEAEALRSAGLDVVTADTSNPTGTLGKVGAFAVAPWNPASAYAVDRLAKTHRPDVVHVHNTWYRLTPSIFATLRRHRIPVVMTLHNYRLACANAVLFRDGAQCTDCVGTHPWRSVGRKCYRDSSFASAVAAGTIAVNRALGTWDRSVDRYITFTEFARDLMSRNGLSRDAISVVPSIVDEPEPRHDPPSASTTIVCIGRIDRGKGIDLLLEAWRRASSPYELVIVGAGPASETLRRGAPPRTRFVGWRSREEIDHLLLTARTLAFPSRYFETFGLSIGEAMAAGLPVIANDVGTRSEAVGRDGAGWLVENGSLDGWVTALQALEDDAAVDAAGIAARRRYEDRHRPEEVAALLTELYSDVIARYDH